MHFVEAKRNSCLQWDVGGSFPVFSQFICVGIPWGRLAGPPSEHTVAEGDAKWNLKGLAQEVRKDASRGPSPLAIYYHPP